MGKYAGTLKADHSSSWAMGEELAAEALATRSLDLVRMIHKRGKEGIDSYRQQLSEGIVNGIMADEIELPEPTTEDAVKAVVISCGMALIDALEKEA